MLQAEAQDQGNVNLRQKGVMHKTGKIFKGSINDAESKCSIGSIPSTYEGIIYRASPAQAFGSSCQRFDSQFRAVNISPSMYNLENQLTGTKSFNQKGGGSLLSKVQREVFSVKPSSGSRKCHEDEKSVSTAVSDTRLVHRRKSSGNGKRKSKVIGRFVSEENWTPGPGAYEVREKNRREGCSSSFRSGMSRIEYFLKNENPGPGDYSLKQNTHRAVERRQKRELERVDYNKVLEKHLRPQGSVVHINLKSPDFTPKYIRIKNSPGFVYNGRDRFGKAEEPQNSHSQQDNLGPGTYDLKSTFKENKQFVGSSSFLTNTVRDLFSDSSWKYGPNIKEISLGKRKEFNLNLDTKWI